MKAVESDPYRYGLEIEEVSRRRGFVDEVGNEVGRMRGEVDAPFQGAAGGAGGPGGGLPDPDEFEMHDHDEDREGGGDHYAAMEQQRQTELMAEQDQQLTGVYRTVGNLRDQATDMGRELEEQTGMLGEVDNLADRVGGKLSSGMSKMKYVIRKNEGEFVLLSWFYIGWLGCANVGDLARYVVVVLHCGADLRPCFITYLGHCFVRQRKVVLVLLAGLAQISPAWC